MTEKYKGWNKGFEGHNIRAPKNERNLHDLIRWLEYGKTSGFIASRCSKEQEEYWADQLKGIMPLLEKSKPWLLSRELDIATGYEDFGELKEVFKVLIGREAKC